MKLLSILLLMPILFAFLLLVAVSAQSAPFVVSDSTMQTVTHCGLLLDSAAKLDVPVVTVTDGKICKFDLSAVTAGVHSIKATFVNIDPVWGRSESVASVPFTFTRPASTMGESPAGLVIIP